MTRPEEYARAARSALGRRWRVERRDEPSGAITLSAEKGYTRETGNLIFHIALLSALILIAVGRLYSYQGSVIVAQGQGFCNVVTSYDAWRPGRLAAEGKVSPAPFCIDNLDKFTAQYLPDGQPSKFAAAVTYSARHGRIAEAQGHQREPSAAPHGRPRLPDRSRLMPRRSRCECRTARCAMTRRRSSRRSR